MLSWIEGPSGSGPNEDYGLSFQKTPSDTWHGPGESRNVGAPDFGASMRSQSARRRRHWRQEGRGRKDPKAHSVSVAGAAAESLEPCSRVRASRPGLKSPPPVKP